VVAVQPNHADHADRAPAGHRQLCNAGASHRRRRDQAPQGFRLLTLEGGTGLESGLRTEAVGDAAQAVAPKSREIGRGRLPRRRG
jgi:hypothetical protein